MDNDFNFQRKHPVHSEWHPFHLHLYTYYSVWAVLIGKSFVANIGDDLNITVPTGLYTHVFLLFLFRLHLMGQWFSANKILTFKIGLWKEQLQPHTPSLPYFSVGRPPPHRFRKKTTTTTRHQHHHSPPAPYLHWFILANLGEVLVRQMGLGGWLRLMSCECATSTPRLRCGEDLLSWFWSGLPRKVFCLLFFLTSKTQQNSRSDCILDTEPVVVHVPNQRTNSFDARQNGGSLDKMNLKPLEGVIEVHTVHRKYHHLENIWYHSWTHSWQLYTSENWGNYAATAATKKQPCNNNMEF